MKNLFRFNSTNSFQINVKSCRQIQFCNFGVNQTIKTNPNGKLYKPGHFLLRLARILNNKTRTTSRGWCIRGVFFGSLFSSSSYSFSGTWMMMVVLGGVIVPLHVATMQTLKVRGWWASKFNRLFALIRMNGIAWVKERQPRSNWNATNNTIIRQEIRELVKDEQSLMVNK